MGKLKLKDKKGTNRRIKRKHNSGIDNTPVLELYSYEITDEPIKDKAIPDEIQNEMESLFENSQKAPHLAIKRLEELIDKYPNVPQLYNFISAAHSRLNNKELATQYTLKNYQKNPNYLFAKLNYVEICIIEKNYEKIPEILNNKFDIKALYPERNIFHITEVAGFMGIVGWYFAAIGKNEQAQLFYKNLKQIAPDHPVTKRLKKHLFVNSVQNGLAKLLTKLSNKP